MKLKCKPRVSLLTVKRFHFAQNEPHVTAKLWLSFFSYGLHHWTRCSGSTIFFPRNISLQHLILQLKIFAKLFSKSAFRFNSPFRFTFCSQKILHQNSYLFFRIYLTLYEEIFQAVLSCYHFNRQRRSETVITLNFSFISWPTSYLLSISLAFSVSLASLRAASSVCASSTCLRLSRCRDRHWMRSEREAWESFPILSHNFNKTINTF